MKLEDEFIQLYEKWLMDYCPEVIRCKDDLVKLSEGQIYWDEFVTAITELF